jgi:hypothetical protein
MCRLERSQRCFVSSSHKIFKLHIMSSKNTSNVIGILRHLMWSRLNSLQHHPGSESVVPNPSEGPQTGEFPVEIRKAEADKCDSGAGADTTPPTPSCVSPASEPADKESDEGSNEGSPQSKSSPLNHPEACVVPYVLTPSDLKPSACPRDVSVRSIYCEPNVLGSEPLEGDWKWRFPTDVEEPCNGANFLHCEPGHGGKCLQGYLGKREDMKSTGILNFVVEFVDPYALEEEKD